MIFLRWLINALALIIVSLYVPGFEVHSTYSALIAAFILGLANAIIRPVLLILTLPITILTLGLFTLVVNALIILLVSSIVKGFDVTSFKAAFWGAIILWLIGWFTNSLLKSNEA